VVSTWAPRRKSTGFWSDLAQAGSSILLISSEMEEVLGLSHRVGVMHDGRLTGVLDRSQATQETVIRLATGGSQ